VSQTFHAWEEKDYSLAGIASPRVLHGIGDMESQLTIYVIRGNAHEGVLRMALSV